MKTVATYSRWIFKETAWRKPDERIAKNRQVRNPQPLFQQTPCLESLRGHTGFGSMFACEMKTES
jgi:hypothetical protein